MLNQNKYENKQIEINKRIKKYEKCGMDGLKFLYGCYSNPCMQSHRKRMESELKMKTIVAKL